MSCAYDVIGNLQDHLGDCYINNVKKIYNFYSYKQVDKYFINVY